jgi:hypothetical protein
MRSGRLTYWTSSAVCELLFLDTAVGKACHMQWSERLSLALSTGGLALAVPDSVSASPMTTGELTCQGDIAALSVEWGRSLEQHKQLCYYLPRAAP